MQIIDSTFLIHQGAWPKRVAITGISSNITCPAVHVQRQPEHFDCLQNGSIY